MVVQFEFDRYLELGCCLLSVIDICIRIRIRILNVFCNGICAFGGVEKHLGLLQKEKEKEIGSVQTQLKP